MAGKRTTKTRGALARIAERGAQLLEAAIVTPMVVALGVGVAEPLVVMHRYNSAYHQLTELVDDARGNKALLGDFWNRGEGPEYTAFKTARKSLSDRFASAMSGVGGVSFKKVRHLDRLGTEARLEELNFGYLPPLTSALVEDWNEGPSNWASLNNYHACGVVASANTASETEMEGAHDRFNARKRLQGLRDSEAQPSTSRAGGRGTCRIIKVPAAELGSWNSLSSVSTKLPTEVVAVVEVKGIVGSYPMVMAVPFYPQVAQPVTAPSCEPRQSSGSWSAWSAECGPGTRTNSYSDSCGNSSGISESRCQPCFDQLQSGWGKDNPNREWSPYCEADGKRRQWRWERDRGGCQPNRNHTEVAGCRASDSSCGWNTQYGLWSTSCNTEGKQSRLRWEQDACGNKRNQTTEYRGGWSSQSGPWANTCDSNMNNRQPTWEQDFCGNRRNESYITKSCVKMCDNGSGIRINSSNHEDSDGQCNTSCHWAGKHFIKSAGDGGTTPTCVQSGAGCLVPGTTDDSLCNQCRYYVYEWQNCAGSGVPGLIQNQP
jgi:hypothetical protein